jgi:UDP-glucose-4-epimerase GalE
MDATRAHERGEPPIGPVLVTGGAGYIGSHTVRLLQRQGVSVVVVDNLSKGHRQAVDGPIEVLDLGDRAKLDALFERVRPRSVVHFAAQAYVGESVAEPAKYYLENVHYTWVLLQAMRRVDCSEIVFSSSCATYGNPVHLPLDEEHPQAPISPYGRTKLHMEHMLQDFGAAYGMRWAALRYFNAAGASRDGRLGEDHEPETHLIPLVLQAAQGTRPEVRIFGDDYDTPDGTCVRDYVHVEDLADAHVRALGALQRGVRALACNLGTGTGYSVRQVIETARAVTGREIRAQVVARRAGDPPRLVSGGSRARELLGWTPQRPGLADIVGDAWNFLVRHPRGYAE